jgi:hypothetical protein
MSDDGYLPPGVTHQMIEDHFGGPEDEGVEVDLIDGRIASISLSGHILVIELFDAIGDAVDDGVMEFDLGSARALSRAIAERVM